MANRARHEFKTASSFPDYKEKQNTTAERESEKVQISREKLEELRDTLKTAFEDYVHPRKSFTIPTTLEGELVTYTAKLIGQVKIMGDNTKHGEKDQSHKLKSRITQIKHWLEKLKDQIENEQFEPKEMTENKEPETREISILVRDLCMKLNAKQNEKVKHLQELNNEFVGELKTEAAETWNPEGNPNVSSAQTKELQPLSITAEIRTLRECLKEHQRQKEVQNQTVKEVKKSVSELWTLLTKENLEETDNKKHEATKHNQQNLSSLLADTRGQLDKMAKWLQNAQQAVIYELKCLEKEVLNWDVKMTEERRKGEQDKINLIQKVRKIREEIKKRKEMIQDGEEAKQTEENDQLKECLDLIQKSLMNIKTILLSEPLSFENPRKGQENVEEFGEKFRTPLLLVLETENIVTKNAKLFSDRFVERNVVIAQLREMFSSIMKEELNIESNRQGNEKRSVQNKKASEEVKMPVSIIEFTDSITQKFKEHGITIKEKHQRINALERKTTELRSQIERLTEDLKQLEADLSEQRRKSNEIEKEREELLTRLSKEVSAKLTDNNPNIADLSDVNRPSKLAEKYSELYDNEWTDTFDALEKSSVSPQEALKRLYNIFVEVFQECGKYARRQDFAMRSILICPTTEFVIGKNADSNIKGGNTQALELRSVLSKSVSEVRKLSVIECTEDMLKHLKTTKKKWFKTKEVENFVNECIRLCWLMQVQSPPIDIDTDTAPGAKFDKNKYKEYTKTGKIVEFVVWPALFLSKGGPVLSKGVAQGK